MHARDDRDSDGGGGAAGGGASGALIGTIPGTLPFFVGRLSIMTADRIVGFVQDEDGLIHLASWRITR